MESAAMQIRKVLVGSILVLVGVAFGAMLNRQTVAQQGIAPAASTVGRFEMRPMPAQGGSVVVVTDTTTGQTWAHGYGGAWNDFGVPPMPPAK
jgi:hypothetical protein